jgi:hypothetical protein
VLGCRRYLFFGAVGYASGWKEKVRSAQVPVKLDQYTVFFIIAHSPKLSQQGSVFSFCQQEVCIYEEMVSFHKAFFVNQKVKIMGRKAGSL